jgi:[ribosomal protein S5]-alanine N-acetyltransferase
MEQALDYPDPPLADDLVVLRRWTESDLDCVAQASQDPRIPEGTTVPAVFTDEEGLAFIRRQWARSTDGQGISFAIADAGNDQAVGALVLLFRSYFATVGLGYWISPPARHRGYATHAVRLGVRWALTEAGLARVEALVEPENGPSIKVLERSSFQREGMLRSYLVFGRRRADALMYSVIATDLDG